MKLTTNTMKVLKLLYEENRPLTRDEIAEKLKMPKTTVFDQLIKLYLLNIVKRGCRKDQKRGRSRITWVINQDILNGPHKTLFDMIMRRKEL